MQGIVDEVYKLGITKLEAGTVALNNSTGVDNTARFKILTTHSAGNPSSGDVGKAATIFSTVRGKD